MADTPQHPCRPPQPSEFERDPDLLAAVVLHTLVSHGRGGEGQRDGMTLAEVAIACERDPTNAAARREVRAALEILLADDLASRRAALWRPTRAAVRAAELSF